VSRKRGQLAGMGLIVEPEPMPLYHDVELKLLKDAIETQSKRALALYYDVMYQGSLHAVETQKKAA
jgi:hypothetical protein